MTTKKKPTATKKPAAKKKSTLTLLKEAMLKEHKPFGVGDMVYVLFLPFKGDAFGSTKDTTGYFETYESKYSEDYPVISYAPTTGLYTVRDMEGDAIELPFYVLKLHTKNDGRTFVIGNEDAKINTNGTVVDVGCQSIKFAEVKMIHDAMVKLQKKPARATAVKSNRMPMAPVAPAM